MRATRLTIATLALGLTSIAAPALAAAPDRCGLLKDAEVDEVIGAHAPGNLGMPNEWGNNSCRWTARNAPAGKAPEGWRDAIEVAVFEGMMLSWAKDQMRGEPVQGISKGAKFDSSYGDLWFECAGGRMCVVKVRTAASKDRRASAIRLAKLVDSRVK